MCVRKREIIISDGLGLLTKDRMLGPQAIVMAEVNDSRSVMSSICPLI